MDVLFSMVIDLAKALHNQGHLTSPGICIRAVKWSNLGIILTERLNWLTRTSWSKYNSLNNLIGSCDLRFDFQSYRLCYGQYCGFLRLHELSHRLLQRAYVLLAVRNDCFCVRTSDLHRSQIAALKLGFRFHNS